MKSIELPQHFGPISYSLFWPVPSLKSLTQLLTVYFMSKYFYDLIDSG